MIIEKLKTEGIEGETVTESPQTNMEVDLEEGI